MRLAGYIYCMEKGYSIVHIESKGLGVIANKDFKVGDSIFTDSPFVSSLDSLADLEELDMCWNCLCPFPSPRPSRFPEQLPALKFDRILCSRRCGIVFCSERCSQVGHICSSDIAFNDLRADPLWQSSSRFRLFCSTVNRIVTAFILSDCAGELVLSTLKRFAVPVLRHNHDDQCDVRDEFLRQMNRPIKLLRATMYEVLASSQSGRNDDCMLTTSRVSREIENNTTPDAYERFWRVCSANAQGIIHPSLADMTIRSFGTRSLRPLQPPQFVQEGAEDQSNAADCFCALQNLPAAGFRSVRGTGLFPELCRLNHECIPNATVHSTLSLCDGNTIATESEAVGPFGVFALRSIRIGEEVCISYLGPDFERDESHRSSFVNDAGKYCHEELLERYGFRCTCALDTDW